MGQHRTSLQILADMLDAAGSGARKTRIMYQANLSFRLLNRYLGYALEIELVSAPCSSDGCYALTPKGYEFLEKYKYSLRSKQLEEQQRAIVKEKATLEENYVAKMSGV